MTALTGRMGAAPTAPPHRLSGRGHDTRRSVLMHPQSTTVAFGDPRLPERFWAKVEVQPSGCWEWTAARDKGYGKFGSREGLTNLAHRYAYIALVADPGERVLDHLCRGRACVNPAHLEPVTDRVNVLRGVGLAAINVAKTHCAHGHEFTPENTYRSSKGWRECRICRERHCRDRRDRRAK